MKFSKPLKKNADFHNVYQNGNSRANRFLVLYVLKNNSRESRLGISVSKKVGNSIVRHRLTRLVRESYRLNEELFQKGLDLVVILRVNAKKASYHEIEKALIHLMDIHKIRRLEKSEECDLESEN